MNQNCNLNSMENIVTEGLEVIVEPRRITKVTIQGFLNLDGIKINYDCGNCEKPQVAVIKSKVNPVKKCYNCNTANEFSIINCYK